ncbi:hypothetical protein BDY24DRAFT_379950 [Mrakia frigida]|uniref:uncharacterized protein n=1 Tax=Mrakia frigida TaxID=29902 RepID=UPI003FCC03A1
MNTERGDTAMGKDPSKFRTPFGKQSNSPMQTTNPHINGIRAGYKNKHGNIHDCYKFWQSFSRCYANAESEQVCKNQWEDYRECYTNRKERERVARIAAQFETNQLAQGKSRAEVRRLVRQGIVASVNLIEAESDMNEVTKGVEVK